MRLLRALFKIAETPAFLRSLFEQMEKTMRCISNFEQLSLGFYVGRPDKHYVVAISYAGNLAFITTESFNEMLARGHAQSEPFLCWRTRNSMFGSIDGVLGGARIFRCDVEVEDDLVWLVPEKEESEDLLVLTADYWQRGKVTTNFVGGVQRLATVVERGYPRSFHLIKLVPDSGVETSTEVSTSAPTTSGFLRTFRKGTVMTEVVKDKALYLNRDLTLNI